MRRLLHGLIAMSLGLVLCFVCLLGIAYGRSQTIVNKSLSKNTSFYYNPLKVKETKQSEVSISITFLTSTDEQVLNDVYIEVLSTVRDHITCIRIPTNTSIEIPSSVYQKLTARYPKTPQYFSLAYLPQMMEDSDRYAYAQRILDSMLSMDSSCYVQIATDARSFQEYYREKEMQHEELSIEEREKWYEMNYNECKTNRSLEEWIEYSHTYWSVPTQQREEQEIQGVMHTDSFEIDRIQFLLDLKRFQ